MIEIKGAHNTAIVFADEVEPSAMGQIAALCDMPFVQGSRIRIMPDVHAGAGCTIGTTMTVKDKIIPNLVGVDIGCGLEVARLDTKKMDFSRLDSIIRQTVPSGFEVRRRPHPYADEIDLPSLRCAKFVKIDRGYRSIGTLGGGNHFIEVNGDDSGNLYLVVHSGSRRLGLEVAGYYQKEGYARLTGSGKRGRGSRKKTAADRSDIPKPLAYVEGGLFDDYIHDMRLTQSFASLNRKAMMKTMLDAVGAAAAERFTTIHNYIDTDSMILRKGAVSAREGEKLIIPMNMRDGSLICTGLGNPNWNFSAPHGAGRLMSRTEAKSSLCMDEYKKSMEGIFSTSVGRHTLDEAPMAYKPMDEILKHIGDTVTVDSHIKPLYNFKAGD